MGCHIFMVLERGSLEFVGLCFLSFRCVFLVMF